MSARSALTASSLGLATFANTGTTLGFSRSEDRPPRNRFRRGSNHGDSSVNDGHCTVDTNDDDTTDTDDNDTNDTDDDDDTIDETERAGDDSIR